MKTRALLSMTVIVVAATSMAMTSTDDTTPEKTGASAAAAQFEQLKTLAGEWRGTGDFGEESTEADISYKITAAGSVVMAILEEAGLIIVRREGRKRYNYLNAVPIRRIYERWVSKYAGVWASSLLSLKRQVEKDE